MFDLILIFLLSDRNQAVDKSDIPCLDASVFGQLALFLQVILKPYLFVHSMDLPPDVYF
jgi:hypothetical protein